jgi:Icc protein
MKNRFFSILLICLLISVLLGTEEGISQNKEASHHIVLLSDPHLPGKNLPLKQQVVENINSWTDVDSVIVSGDICEESGTVKEYESAKRFLSKIKPFYPIAGNRDHLYEDKSPGEKFRRASESVRKKKLERFKETFSLANAFYSIEKNDYLLIFLSPDHPTSNNRSHITEEQLNWLKSQLARYKSKPTIIFFHAPLKGTLTGNNQDAHDPADMAQPIPEIRQLIMDNPQIFLWFSGHTHLVPTNSNFNHPVNVYEKRVLNIHNPDMSGDSYLKETDVKSKAHDDMWTNSLFLFSSKVVVKTYDHKKGTWIESLTRKINLPKID